MALSRLGLRSIRSSAVTRVSSPRRQRSTEVENATWKAGATGLAAGSAGSLMGMGGGFISIPILTGTLKLSQHAAHGTSLCAVLACGLGGAVSYGFAGCMDMQAALAIAAAGSFSANLGARATTLLSQTRLKQCLGAFMIFIGPTIPLKGHLKKKDDEARAKEGGASAGPSAGSSAGSADAKESGSAELFGIDMEKAMRNLTIGLGTGFLSGLFGVGGGAITVPALTFFNEDMNFHTALGTSLGAMVPISMVGVATHAKLGNVVPRIAAPLAAGTMLGAFGMAQVGVQIPEEHLHYFFCAVMVLLGSRTVAGTLKK